MDRALSLLADGTLRIDAGGAVWRHRIISHGESVPVAPRRAENVGCKGYYRISLQDPDTRRLLQVMAHRLVWEASNGPIADGLQINHKDLNKQNNRVDNLETVTASGNMRHSYDHGRTMPWGESVKEWRGKLRIQGAALDVILAARATGDSYPVLARKFGISQSHAHRLCSKGIE